MATKTYIIPRSYYAKMVLNRIARLVPCCMSRVEDKAFSMSFTITCKSSDFTMIESILRNEGWL